MAGWQSGYAEDCNSLYVGSIPAPAFSKYSSVAQLVEQVIVTH